jgi:hypothetical protein
LDVSFLRYRINLRAPINASFLVFNPLIFPPVMSCKLLASLAPNASQCPAHPKLWNAAHE